MPRETYEIEVEVLNRVSRENAIATAASYLSYADQTDTIGHNPSYNNVSVRSNDAGPISVTFEVSVTLARPNDYIEFIDELDALSKLSQSRIRTRWRSSNVGPPCNECGTEMLPADDLDSEKANYVCPECAPDWVLANASTYTSVDDPIEAQGPDE
jgi:hypothetical protein